MKQPTLLLLAALNTLMPLPIAQAGTDFGTKYIIITQGAQGHSGWNFVETGFANQRLNSTMAATSGGLIAEGGGGPFAGPADVSRYPSSWTWSTPTLLNNFSHQNVLDSGFGDSGPIWAQHFKQAGIVHESAYIDVSNAIEVFPQDLLTAAGNGQHRITARFYYSAELAPVGESIPTYDTNAYIRIFCPKGPRFEQATSTNIDQQSLEVTYTFEPSACKGPLMIHTLVSGSDVVWRGIEFHHKQL